MYSHQIISQLSSSLVAVVAAAVFFWFVHFLLPSKSNEPKPSEREGTKRRNKSDASKSKWLVFKVIIASHCGKCLDISYENINHAPMRERCKEEPNREPEPKYTPNAHTCTNKCACKKKEINLHNWFCKSINFNCGFMYFFFSPIQKHTLLSLNQ